ncbi:hypothetical protein LPN01_18720 [Sphingomonas sp. A2-49]|nr:hypothetical protein [Sphingomonas sp. A2-49]MCU6456117.1 hypothetical protein [Sphingomonas sp. A2-49]
MERDRHRAAKGRRGGADIGAAVATMVFVAGFGGMIWALGSAIGLF